MRNTTLESTDALWFIAPPHVSMEATPTYYALRVCPRSSADHWWTSARRQAHSAPPAVRRILAGRQRVELTAQEAIDAIAWARALDGWDADALAPLWVYPFAPPG